MFSWLWNCNHWFCTFWRLFADRLLFLQKLVWNNSFLVHWVQVFIYSEQLCCIVRLERWVFLHSLCCWLIVRFAWMRNLYIKLFQRLRSFWLVCFLNYRLFLFMLIFQIFKKDHLLQPVFFSQQYQNWQLLVFWFNCCWDPFMLFRFGICLLSL